MSELGRLASGGEGTAEEGAGASLERSTLGIEGSAGERAGGSTRASAGLELTIPQNDCWPLDHQGRLCCASVVVHTCDIWVETHRTAPIEYSLPPNMQYGEPAEGGEGGDGRGVVFWGGVRSEGAAGGC
jgi:hypothetical protein